MQIVTSIASLRDLLDAERTAGRTVGLVPTMGFLHAGHASLIEHAARDCDVVVTTIFVNPLQFAPSEDLASYPRDLDGDSSLARSCGATVLFVPSVDEMYPEGAVLTSISVSGLSAVMEGAARPTHFDGVCTVVSKFFHIVGRCRAYFGEKDFQQLAVIRRMAADLSAPVVVVGCPIVRDDDGLALSSRNTYLSPTQRAAAPVLNRSLRQGAQAVADGEHDADVIRRIVRDAIEAEPLAELDYVEVADPATLEPVTVADRTSRLFGAATFGRARLIDNVSVSDVVAS